MAVFNDNTRYDLRFNVKLCLFAVFDMLKVAWTEGVERRVTVRPHTICKVTRGYDCTINFDQEVV